MDAHALIASLAARGVVLRVLDGRLVASPASRLTSEDADRIRSLRDALVDALTTGTMRRRNQSHCVTCGGSLPPDTWARCHACVDAAYLARDERRRLEGRAPPAADTSAAPPDAHPHERTSPR